MAEACKAFRGKYLKDRGPVRDLSPLWTECVTKGAHSWWPDGPEAWFEYRVFGDHLWSRRSE